MAHLIKVDFTCIAKCNMLRLLVTSIIAHMPPTSPAREDQVSSTTIKVRTTLQLQWCIFFHNRDWSIVAASSSLRTVQTHQCITASQEESELWRMILPQCMHVAFYWFWQETTTNLGNTLTYSPAGFFGEWQHLAKPHMGREREAFQTGWTKWGIGRLTVHLLETSAYNEDSNTADAKALDLNVFSET